MHQQTWLVLLMTFVLSWSSVSIANAQSKHSMNDLMLLHYENMLASHIQLQTEHYHHTADHLFGAMSCHDRVQSTHQTQVNYILSSCHHMDHMQSHQQGCLDCHTLHCQNLNVMLDTDVLTVQQPRYASVLQQFNGHYLAQDLHGYWQEILRPPKA